MRTIWTIALVSLACAVVLALTACDDNVATGQPLAPPHQPRVKVVSSLGAAVRTGWVPDFLGPGNTSLGCMRAVGAGRFALPMSLEEGDRMLAVTVAVLGDGAFGLTIAAHSATPDGFVVPGVIDALTVPVTSPGWLDLTLDFADTDVEAGTSHWFEVSSTGGVMSGGICVGAMRLTYVPGA